MNSKQGAEIEDDEALVAACRSRQPSVNRSFELLVRRYESRVFRTCLRMLGNEQDAEDIMQEIFVKVFRNLHVFEGRSSFGTWLFTIARNECLSAISKRAARLSHETDARDDEHVQSADAPPDVELEHSDLLSKTLARLKPDDREILIARFASGLRIEEMAAVFEVSVSAAKMRLYRAMERFASVSDEISGKQ